MTALLERPTSRRLERWGLWAGVAVAYVLCAYVLASHLVLSGDAMSRTLSAANTVTGRDPHLESIGFVWPPFPAMFQIPLVALSRWFPSLVSLGLAGTIVSALLMATMVASVRQWLEESGVSRPVRLCVAVLLAVHPFVLLYAGNGMSEASMLCFLVIAANRLARWWERETPLDLIACGLALAMAYLSRYEVGLSILLVVAAVFAEGIRRSPGDLRARARRGLVCAASVGFIPFSAIAVWAAWSWTTIGEPFAQFTSQYGNSAIVAGAGVSSGVDRLVLFLTQAAILGGAAAVLILASIWFGTRGLARVVSVIVVVLTPLAFNLAAAYSGTTFAFARFSITLIPAAVMLLGPLLAGFRELGTRPRFVWASSAAAIATFVAAGLIALPVMWDGRYGTADEADQLRALPGPYRNDRPAHGVRTVEKMRRIAHDIDAMRLPDNSVLSDDFSSFLIVASSTHRTQFVTTPDRDFERTLSAPRIFGVKYLLVPDNDNPYYDAVRDVWPGVFEGTNPIGRSVREWGTDREPGTHYRLVKIAPRT
ncbi:MAG: glycosyltransferase family 39 protein [Acidimicrobiales bacterium]